MTDEHSRPISITDDRANTDSSDRTAASRGPTASRRRFLRTTAGVGALAMGGAAGFSEPAEAVIPTPRLHRDGNLLRDPDGNRVVLHGVNVVDPWRAARDAPHYKRRVPEYIKMATDEDEGWHSQIIRLPMQPQDIAGEGAGAIDPVAFTEAELVEYLDEYVDPAVAEAKEQGTYIMLDYHRHYEEGPEWTDPELDEEIRLFWNTVAPRYADETHVIYELYNEPTEPYAGDDLGPNESVDVISDEGEQTWLRWRETAQPWVDLVRDHAPETLIVIGSPRWSQWTYWAQHHEFEGENLAYSGHVYTQEGVRPLSEYFGSPSEEVPVFMSEWGFEEDAGPNYLIGSADEEGQEFLEFYEEYDTIHTQAWCFDFDWEPAMLDRDYNVATEWGELVREFLAEKRDEDTPGGGSNGNNGNNGDEDVIEVGEYETRDTTDDGLHNDFTGNGETTHDDVSAFFETIDSDGVQNNPEAFDFNGDGDVGFGDVVELLRDV